MSYERSELVRKQERQDVQIIKFFIDNQYFVFLALLVSKSAT
jgi:hypothetical protein